MKVLLLEGSVIEKLVGMKEFIEIIEKVFKAKAQGKTQMPPKSYVYFSEYDGDFRAMPAYVEDLNIAGVKIVNVHPSNPERYNLPSVMATIFLLDPRNGKPIAILEGTWITNMRTGAAGGVAAKYLARKNSKIIGMVGAGAQARTQLLALNEILKIEEVKVCSKTRENSRKFIEDMKFLNLNMRAEDKIEDVVRGCDILVTTTPVREPIVKNEWIDEGTHINAIGADAKGKEELDPEILKRAKVVVDDYEQAIRSGEINVPISKGIFKPEQIHAELGEVLIGKKEGRVSNEEITVFDSTGLAIQDVASGWLVLQKAMKEGIGKEIEL